MVSGMQVPSASERTSSRLHWCWCEGLSRPPSARARRAPVERSSSNSVGGCTGDEQLKRYTVGGLPVESQALSFLLCKAEKREAHCCQAGDFEALYVLANQHLCLIVK